MQKAKGLSKVMGRKKREKEKEEIERKWLRIFQQLTRSEDLTTQLRN